jgi:antitoxin component of MazEF toxin-antitoxin module
MVIKYQKVWDTMNELESVTSKICSAREILDCAIEAHENHNHEKVEHLLHAVDEFLVYYLKEFDDKFKKAWQATVGDLREGDVVKQKSSKKWDLPVDKIGDDYFVTFPDDLLQAANLQEGDHIEWIDQGDGSYLLKKVWADPYKEDMLKAGYEMVDGVWTLKE